MELEEENEFVEEPGVHEPRFGGYDFVFVDELALGQTCSVCLVAMRNPVQTMCGHRFCEDCLLGTFRQCNDRVCPQDRNPIPEEGGFFRDVAWEREILSLRVRCKQSERGCEWTGELRHYEGHFSRCQYEDVVCDDCEGEMQRRFLDTHSASECQNRIVQCEHCEEEFAFWFLVVHEDGSCPRFPIQCPQQCGVREIPREEMEAHVRDECLMTVVVCPYEGAGCTFHDTRINLEAHIEESSKDHLSKTWSELYKAKQKLSELEKIRERVETLQSEKESMKASLERNSEEINDLKLSEKKLEVENMTLRKDVLELGRQLGEVKSTVANEQKESNSLKHLVLSMQTQNTTLGRNLTELERQVREEKWTTAHTKKERNALKELSEEVTEMRSQLQELKLHAATEKETITVKRHDWLAGKNVNEGEWSSGKVEEKAAWGTSETWPGVNVDEEGWRSPEHWPDVKITELNNWGGKEVDAKVDNDPISWPKFPGRVMTSQKREKKKRW